MFNLNSELLNKINLQVGNKKVSSDATNKISASMCSCFGQCSGQCGTGLKIAPGR